MKKLKTFFNYFSKFEIVLWSVSIFMIALSFCLFDHTNYWTLLGLIVGVSALIFNAKGNPIGQILIILFCIIYGCLSLSLAYYGEMITYWGMSFPMAIFSLIAWLKNPHNGNKNEIEISIGLSKKRIIIMFLLAIVVTIFFYFILRFFNTTNLIVSTFSVTTSFVAVFLTSQRSPYYALAYVANDLVLIVLWTFDSFKNIASISLVVCFVAFLANDLYGFFNWRKIRKRQLSEEKVSNNA